MLTQKSYSLSLSLNALFMFIILGLSGCGSQDEMSDQGSSGTSPRDTSQSSVQTSTPKPLVNVSSQDLEHQLYSSENVRNNDRTFIAPEDQASAIAGVDQAVATNLPENLNETSVQRNTSSEPAPEEVTNRRSGDSIEQELDIDEPSWQPIPGKQLSGLQGQYRLLDSHIDMRWLSRAAGFGYRLEVNGASMGGPMEHWWLRPDDTTGQNNQQLRPGNVEHQDPGPSLWSREITIPFELGREQAVVTITQMVELERGSPRNASVGLIELSPSSMDPATTSKQINPRSSLQQGPVETLPDGRRMRLAPAIKQ